MKCVLSGLVCGYSGRPVGPVGDRVWSDAGLHALIGSNGAGKSTLIRTLAGLQPPIAGSVHLGDSDVHRMRPAARAQLVAFVASTPPGGSGLTAGEVLQLMAATDVQRREALERFGDSRWWSVRLSELSDGQRQRVMLARSFLQNTPWILLDEPTAFLDAASRTRLFGHFNELAAQGKGIVLATHDLHLLHGQPALKTVNALGSQWLEVPTDAAVADWEAAT
jgi:iron complex transport system ATP-binding protein